MVNNKTKKIEAEDIREAILTELKNNPKGITITGLEKNCKSISRGQIRTSLAYLLGAGKIEEVRASMAKLYYLV